MKVLAYYNQYGPAVVFTLPGSDEVPDSDSSVLRGGNGHGCWRAALMVEVTANG